MPVNDAPLRRRFLQLAGVTAGNTVFAGCFDEGATDGEHRGGGPRDGGHRGGGADDGTGDGGLTIDSGTEIVFATQTSYWEGLAPSSIESEQNPTSFLQPGADYTIDWTEDDGGGHTFEIRAENDETVFGLATEVVTEPDQNPILAIIANSEMAQYGCVPHENTMRGPLRVR